MTNGWKFGEGPAGQGSLLDRIEHVVYVVPPSMWSGYVHFAGYYAHGSALSDVGDVITAVQFEYIDAIGDSATSGFVIVSLSPHRLVARTEGLASGGHVTWELAESNDEPRPGSPEVVDFLSRWHPRRLRELRAASTVQRGDPLSIEIAGAGALVRRFGLDGFPDCHMLLCALPGSSIRLVSRGLAESALLDLARALEPLELGSSVFREMQWAQERTDSRWRTLGA